MDQPADRALGDQLPGTLPLSLGVVSTVPSALLSAPETSTAAPPLPEASFSDEVLAEADSASTTQRVRAPASPSPQPSWPPDAICETAASMTAIFFSSSLWAEPTGRALTAVGSKPSSWLTVETACAVLPALMPPPARSAAATTISLNGVMLALVVTVPACDGVMTERIEKPAGSGCAVPVTSSRWVVLPSALAETRTT